MPVKANVQIDRFIEKKRGRDLSKLVLLVLGKIFVGMPKENIRGFIEVSFNSVVFAPLYKPITVELEDGIIFFIRRLKVQRAMCHHMVGAEWYVTEAESLKV